MKLEDVADEVSNSLTGGAITILAAFVAIFSLIKVLLVPELRPFKRAVSSVFIGWPTGVLAGLLSIEWGAGQYAAIAIACLFSLLSENLLLAILNSDFSALLKIALTNLVNKWTK